MTTTLYGTRRSTGRPLAMTVTVGLHVAGLVFLWNTGGFQRLIDEMPKTELVIVDEPVVETPPPPVDYKPRPVDVDLQMPDPIIVVPDSGASTGSLTAIVREGTGTGPVEPVVVARPPVLTALSWTARRSPDDLYPPASIRMGEEGVATVRVCVGPNAKVVGTPEVTSSTGYPRLDQAAIAWTRDALVYKAATEDGRPVEACKGFKVTFDLK